VASRALDTIELHLKENSMLANTSTRVTQHTRPEVTGRIARETIRRVEYFRLHPEDIPDRLAELDREWDIERALETGSSVLSLSGLMLAVLKSRRWLILPLAVQGFFLQHALDGWCPPLPVLRRLGFRTAEEINRERQAILNIQRDQRTPAPHGRPDLA
jgi:hypothetical protein